MDTEITFLQSSFKSDSYHFDYQNKSVICNGHRVYQNDQGRFLSEYGKNIERYEERVRALYDFSMTFINLGNQSSDPVLNPQPVRKKATHKASNTAPNDIMSSIDNFEKLSQGDKKKFFEGLKHRGDIEINQDKGVLNVNIGGYKPVVYGYYSLNPDLKPKFHPIECLTEQEKLQAKKIQSEYQIYCDQPDKEKKSNHTTVNHTTVKVSPNQPQDNVTFIYKGKTTEAPYKASDINQFYKHHFDKLVKKVMEVDSIYSTKKNQCEKELICYLYTRGFDLRAKRENPSYDEKRVNMALVLLLNLTERYREFTIMDECFRKEIDLYKDRKSDIFTPCKNRPLFRGGIKSHEQARKSDCDHGRPVFHLTYASMHDSGFGNGLIVSPQKTVADYDANLQHKKLPNSSSVIELSIKSQTPELDFKEGEQEREMQDKIKKMAKTRHRKGQFNFASSECNTDYGDFIKFYCKFVLNVPCIVTVEDGLGVISTIKSPEIVTKIKEAEYQPGPPEFPS